jgi:hypothetical protein
MRLIHLAFFTFCLSAISAYSQDVLYTITGNKLPAKVVEINSNDIKYKDPKNLDGPTYVISKTDIVLIQYYNGFTEVINANPTTISPKTVEFVNITPVKSIDTVTAPVRVKPLEKKPLNLYYLNNNMLSINALALANGDITLMYDRDFNNKLSLTFLGGYSFNAHMGGLNGFIREAKDNAKKKFDAGVGINFMPNSKRRVQYFVGILGKYMAYDYQNVIDTTNNQKKYKKEKAYQVAIMISNGLIFKVTPNFNFKVFISVGGQINSTPLEVINSDGTKSNLSNYPKAYLGYCFGYRF